MRRVRVVVSGSVQGVFFRASLRDRARHLGVTGWVRNRADGMVEAELQGVPASVEQLVAYCRQGPGQAQVERVDVSDVELVPDESGFAVR